MEWGKQVSELKAELHASNESAKKAAEERDQAQAKLGSYKTAIEKKKQQKQQEQQQQQEQRSKGAGISLAETPSSLQTKGGEKDDGRTEGPAAGQSAGPAPAGPPAAAPSHPALAAKPPWRQQQQPASSSLQHVHHSTALPHAGHLQQQQKPLPRGMAPLHQPFQQPPFIAAPAADRRLSIAPYQPSLQPSSFQQLDRAPYAQPPVFALPHGYALGYSSSSYLQPPPRVVGPAGIQPAFVHPGAAYPIGAIREPLLSAQPLPEGDSGHPIPQARELVKPMPPFVPYGEFFMRDEVRHDDERRKRDREDETFESRRRPLWPAADDLSRNRQRSSYGEEYDRGQDGGGSREDRRRTPPPKFYDRDGDPR